MGGKKFDISTLKKCQDQVNRHLLFSLCGWTAISKNFNWMPLSWWEFNQLYFSTRPVVFQCPSRHWDGGGRTVAFYVTLRRVRHDRRVEVLTNGPENCSSLSILADEYFRALANGKKRTENGRLLFVQADYHNRNPRMADDWVLFLHKDCDVPMGIIEETDGFKKWDEDAMRMDYSSAYEICPRKKFVAMIDTDNKDAWSKLNSIYGDRFLFIPYSEEKMMVDRWFSENETLLDPMFDILIMDGHLNQKRVFDYLITNHLFKFREWAKLNPEMVEKWYDVSLLVGLNIK